MLLKGQNLREKPHDAQCFGLSDLEKRQGEMKTFVSITIDIRRRCRLKVNLRKVG